jgi:hypothetical protein
MAILENIFDVVFVCKDEDASFEPFMEKLQAARQSRLTRHIEYPSDLEDLQGEDEVNGFILLLMPQSEEFVIEDPSHKLENTGIFDMHSVSLHN